MVTMPVHQRHAALSPPSGLAPHVANETLRKRASFPIKNALMRFPFILGCSLILAGCDESPAKRTVAHAPELQDNEAPLTFSPLVEESLKEKEAEIVLDRIFQPGEEQPIPSVVGAGSVGYYVDNQFEREKAGGYVYLYGSDGSSSGVSFGSEFSRQDGPVEASFRAVNTGKLPRRLLVYTTPAKRVKGDSRR
jgi:hypothetical protein